MLHPTKPTGVAAFERKVFSQNGEDGIISEVFRRIGNRNRFFVEFGVEEGLECNSAYLARFKGWAGLFIEGNPKMYERLRRDYKSLSNIKTASEHVTRENIAAIFGRYDVPEEFDLLSIDIDGNDYWVWEALEWYRPRLVVIEYNALYPPPARWIMQYDPTHQWDGTSHHGASLSSLAVLGNHKGYALIGTDSRGINAFFVRSDLLASLHFPELSPEQAYHAPNFGLFFKHHPYRAGPASE